jgi:hypothetical protein
MDIVNNSHIVACIQSIKNSQYKQLLEKYPSLYSSIVSIRSGKDQPHIEKSAQKVLEYANKNAKLKKIFEKWISSQPTVENCVAGKIIVLDKNESSYENLIKISKKENWIYKGIAIVDTFDSIRLYFY